MQDEIFVNDKFQMTNDQNKIPKTKSQLPIIRQTNRAGGLEGGITNGMPIIVRAALKPIATTVTPLRSVDLATGKAALAQYQRSDYSHVPRACVIGEAMVAWVIADALIENNGMVPS